MLVDHRDDEKRKDDGGAEKHIRVRRRERNILKAETKEEEEEREERRTILASYDIFKGYGEEQIAPTSESPQYEVFDVSDFGANPEDNNTLAFERTWEAACQHEGRTKFYVPKGKFLVGAFEFKGPCCTKSTIEVEINGDLVAPSSIKEFHNSYWISFNQLNDIVVYGHSNLDSQGGVEAWKQESCKTASKCTKMITSLKLRSVSNAIIKDISILNSKGFHLGLHSSRNVTIQNVTINSPWDSPNTDGIHVDDSSYVNIINSTIGAGDDCVSISPGNVDVFVFGTHCGPGHGFSIGSLGKNKDEKEVGRITIKNCTINGTDNGVRIKTWPTSPPSQASNITFDDIVMVNVSNPIIIDQEYCPSNSCNTTSASLVKLSNIEFKNIRGTYNNEFGVTLRCSSVAACENITLINVNLNRTHTAAGEMRQLEGFSMKGSLHGLAVFNSTF
ncbi:unnamed protein product [Cochlearia groenlandica]